MSYFKTLSKTVFFGAGCARTPFLRLLAENGVLWYRSLVDLFSKTPKAVRDFWARTKSVVRDDKRAEFKARVLTPKPPSPVIIPR